MQPRETVQRHPTMFEGKRFGSIQPSKINRYTAAAKMIGHRKQGKTSAEISKAAVRDLKHC